MRNRMGISAAVVLCLAGGLQAGIIATDVNGMPGWENTVVFDPKNSGYPTTYFTATVDYCVYAPGSFTQSFPGATVPEGDYVYAYQIVGVAKGPSGAAAYVTQLSLGANPPDGGDALPVDISFVPDPGAIAPSSSTFAAFASGIVSTADWNFGTQLDAGRFSPVLYFASPYGPEWDLGTVSGNRGADTLLLPSPTPEPGTLVLMGLGLSVIVRRVRRRAA